MIDQVKEMTKDLFSNTNTLVSEFFNKHREEKEFFFLQFRPDATISAYELMQVMMLNNTLFGMYGIVVTPLNSFFVTSDIYYKMLPPELIHKHFIFLGSETMELTTAYDKINNSVK